jgi:hypothetical protein
MGELQPFRIDAEQLRTCDALASRLAASALIPPHYRGDVASTMLAVTIAAQTGIHPLQVMQGTYVVSGKLGWGASMLIALANGSGVFDGPLDWRVEGEGPSLSVTCFANLAKSGREVRATVSMAMAKAEGWTKNTKYQTMPELMLKYRSATLLTRLYAPGVLFGIPAADENEDVAAAKRSEPVAVASTVVEPAPAEPAEALNARGHHPSFTREEQRAFMAHLSSLGLDYATEVKPWCEAKGHPKPSAMPQARRAQLARYLAAHVEDVRSELAAYRAAVEATEGNVIDAETEPVGGAQ